MCESCWAGCCVMPVEVKASDLVRMGVAGVEEIEENPKRVAQNLIRQNIIKSYRAATGLFTLAQKNGTDCIFLNEQRLCTIYDKRPDVCRKFPTEVGNRIGYCPAFRK